ncbi:hypothetical protein ACQ3I4_08980 [Zafaria sp. Z1313]|uniref:hypothetical protein n=1 Tax=unclassified Zafaria TaxID=2828765 RepID=UPI002E77EAA9|nr:hypothetical protein [Zafaria sp. J156]MEE1621664.1 hypothetical protein [Zafaria sp. J156]
MATSVVVTAVLWGALIWIGYSSGLRFPVAGGAGREQDWGELGPILATNLAAALGLASGMLTAGLSTFASSIILGLFTGAVFHGAVDALGAAGAAQTLAPYFVFEGLGLLAASVAGFIPVLGLLRHWGAGGAVTVRSSLRAYGAAVRWTLPPLATSLVLITAGAVLEVIGGIPQ